MNIEKYNHTNDAINKKSVIDKTRDSWSEIIIITIANVVIYSILRIISFSNPTSLVLVTLSIYAMIMMPSIRHLSLKNPLNFLQVQTVQILFPFSIIGVLGVILIYIGILIYGATNLYLNPPTVNPNIPIISDVIISIVTPNPPEPIGIQELSCTIRISNESLGIIMYNEEVLNDPLNLPAYTIKDEYFLASDGEVQIIEAKKDIEEKYLWAKIQLIRLNKFNEAYTVTGWVHAESPWSNELPQCEALRIRIP